MSFRLDCVIPYFNEGERLLPVIQSAIKCREINQVIIVDDGSSLMTKLPAHNKLIILRHLQNKGKTAAIRTGLKMVKSDYVFLIDADLIGAQSSMLAKCIRYVAVNQPDMLVIRRINTLPLTKILKMDLLVADERILKTNYLREIITPSVNNYELEPAINEYYLKLKLDVTATTLPYEQYRKIDKLGFFKGIQGDLAAAMQVVNYSGWLGISRMIKDFNPKYVKL